MATDPRRPISPESGGNRAIVNKQEGGIISFDAGDIPGQGMGQVYWREQSN